MTIKQALVFSILMQNRNGILDKAPSYIAEKLESCGMLSHPTQLLDSNNIAIYDAYLKKWGVKGFEVKK